MGIYDRDYYRESTRFNPLDSRVQAFVVLIVIYVAVYILQIATREGMAGRQLKPGPLTEAVVLNADKVFQGEFWRVLTYAFAHNPFHPLPLICNILFLIFYGSSVEDLYGWQGFESFYVRASVMAGWG